jgi:CheY-specific phosphatase CheX
MDDRSIREALRESVEEVLEKMFFIRPLEEAGGRSDTREIAAHTTFLGDPSGELTLRVSQAAARSISADFLGAEEADLTRRQTEEVVCELANMICGSVLSRVERHATFRLAAPRILKAFEPESEAPETAAIHVAGLGSGSLVVALRMDPMEEACASAARPQAVRER